MRTTRTSSPITKVRVIVQMLILGTIANMVIAWFCAVTHHRASQVTDENFVERVLAALGRTPTSGTTGRVFTWPVNVPPDWPARPDSLRTDTTWHSTGMFATAEVKIGGAITDEARAVQYGWPLRSLHEWSYRAQAHGTTAPPHESTRLRLPATQYAWLPNHLPVLPLWPGVALNTFIYAAFAWSLWQLPHALRRHFRQRAGKCHHCGYDLAGLALLAPCPECGATTSRSRRRTSPR